MAGLKFHASESGTGKPVLLLHPVGLDATFWEGLIETLSTRCKVVAVDTAGHGASPDASRPSRMSERVDDVIQLIQDRNLGPAIVLGASFGGMIAQNLALARPDLVDGLILAGCPGRIPAEARTAILKRGTDAEEGGMAAVLDTTIERWFTAEFMSTEAVTRVGQRLMDDKPSNWAAAWEAVAEHDALDRLSAFTKPSLVIAGEKDLATPLAAKEALAAALPAATLVVLPNAPHMMHIEQPNEFHAAVSSYLDRLGVR